MINSASDSGSMEEARLADASTVDLGSGLDSPQAASIVKRKQLAVSLKDIDKFIWVAVIVRS